MTRIFIPRDVAALAVGANKVAAKIVAEAQARGLPIEIIRTGSRVCSFWSL